MKKKDFILYAALKKIQSDNSPVALGTVTYCKALADGLEKQFEGIFDEDNYDGEEYPDDIEDDILDAEEISETPDDYDDITKESLPEDIEAFEEKNKWGMNFRLSPVEYLRWEKFQEDHEDCMENPDGSHKFGTIGGGISISFMGTGLGNLVSCKCHACGKTVDITDSSNW